MSRIGVSSTPTSPSSPSKFNGALSSSPTLRLGPRRRPPVALAPRQASSGASTDASVQQSAQTPTPAAGIAVFPGASAPDGDTAQDSSRSEAPHPFPPGGLVDSPRSPATAVVSGGHFGPAATANSAGAEGAGTQETESTDSRSGDGANGPPTSDAGDPAQSRAHGGTEGVRLTVSLVGGTDAGLSKPPHPPALDEAVETDGLPEGREGGATQNENAESVFFEYVAAKVTPPQRGEWFHSYGVNESVLSLLSSKLAVCTAHLDIVRGLHEERPMMAFSKGDCVENDYVIVLTHELRIEAPGEGSSSASADGVCHSPSRLAARAPDGETSEHKSTSADGTAPHRAQMPGT